MRQDRTYNLGALIAFRLAANREKGGICGGLIASRLLALHGLLPHPLDVQFPVERLDINSMIRHQFVAPGADLYNLPYKISFFKDSRWRPAKSDRLVRLPAPLLFNLNGRERRPLKEEELDAYIEECQRAENARKEAERNIIQPPDIAESSHQPPDYDYRPSASSSSRAPDYEHARYDPPAWNHYPRWE